ncbi:alpha/beta-hydrolase [Stipitochalara longipes BDJ]|nr:alpha/beta-hydrolase [Stipitochalara longipes BDJ]
MSKPDSVPQPVPENVSEGVSLHYTSISPSATSTIVLIHGACCSGSNWDLVAPHLSNSFHLLIPDLPGHGQSRHITPFSVEYSSRLLAQLIRRHAVNGKAHIVGHSLGAHVAINLAGSYSELVDAVFVSGFEIYPPTTFSSLAPYAIWFDQRVQRLVPNCVISWMMDGTNMQGGKSSSCTMDLCRQIAPALVGTTWPSPWPARTLIVAAGKGGIIPSKDHPQDAIKLMEIGRQSNPESIAFRHPLMRHPWNRQDPLLFAQTARAWLDGKEIPAGFEKL